MIVTVPDLHLINGNLFTSDGNLDFMAIHGRQGTLDGACSVYSLAMSLLYENIISYEDVLNPGRSNGGRLIKELFNEYGLVKCGFKFKDLIKIIKKYQTKNWRVVYFNGTAKDCVIKICKEIDNGFAPIVGVTYAGEDWGHALLGVGYEKIEGKVVNIFCLDPDAETPITSIWNSYIDVHDLRRNCVYVNNKMTPYVVRLVRIEDYIVIENLKDIPFSERKYIDI